MSGTAASRRKATGSQRLHGGHGLGNASGPTGEHGVEQAEVLGELVSRVGEDVDFGGDLLARGLAHGVYQAVHHAAPQMPLPDPETVVTGLSWTLQTVGPFIKAGGAEWLRERLARNHKQADKPGRDKHGLHHDDNRHDDKVGQHKTGDRPGPHKKHDHHDRLKKSGRHSWNTGSRGKGVSINGGARKQGDKAGRGNRSIEPVTGGRAPGRAGGAPVGGGGGGRGGGGGGRGGR